MALPNDSATFDAWSRSYDRDTSDETGFPFAGYRRVLQGVLELAAITPARRVLELGVGTGNLTSLLLARGADVWGIDYSAEMLNLARAKAPRATLAQADLLEAFPAEFDRRYDVAVSTYVFHEFPLETKLAILSRLFDQFLAPGARTIIGDIGFPNASARERMRILTGESWDEEHYWLMDETRPALDAIGLQLAWEQISVCGVVLAISRP